MKRSDVLFFFLVFLALSPEAPSAQREMAVTGLAGRVSPAFRLSLPLGWQWASSFSENSDLRLAVKPTGVATLDVTLTDSGVGGSSRVVLPLELRTNDAYRLELTLISSDGCAAAVTASIDSVGASGSSVAPSATEVSRNGASIDLIAGGAPLTLLRGPRISAGGTFTSPGNALSVDLNLAVSPNTANQCSWRTSFRVTLRHS